MKSKFNMLLSLEEKEMILLLRQNLINYNEADKDFKLQAVRRMIELDFTGAAKWVNDRKSNQ